MGSAGSSTTRAVLTEPEQLHFRSRKVEDVRITIDEWFEDGMPLGLTVDMFKMVLKLDSKNAGKVDAEALFRIFDSDGNQKVDALELLSAVTIFANGSLDEKVEALFPVFDFSRLEQLNFDEVNILLQSVSRGLTKVVGKQPLGDEALIEACRRSFDAHNLRYDKQISREQVKRWMTNDVEVMGFMDAFHHACEIPQGQVPAQLVESFRLQADCTPSQALGQDWLRSLEVRKAFADFQEEDLRSLASAMTVAKGRDDIVIDALKEELLKAMNAFKFLDVDGKGEVDVKEIYLILWLCHGSEPSSDAVEQRRQRLGLHQGERFTLSDWIMTSLPPR